MRRPIVGKLNMNTPIMFKKIIIRLKMFYFPIPRTKASKYIEA